ncbi:ABC transporter ATP-binding protein [Bacillus sp. KH172YL63]|uniref:ABC transporter ATP-binding protein n=1 Tax=Bacillus sp. KH172YL63 TaxID=2709784 RepID=UPI0013E4A22D|nr:ABC transporter ATP-binding protein [Bacillus sp. KH172YL63]BCB02743.1 ABC transporter [Bacillus sp. KH172YL63]
MSVVECRGLVKAFGRKQALKDLTFSLGENKITGLIGRNGAGKTTLLKIMAGFFRETDGEISVFSERPFNNLKVSANMIYIDDEMSFSPYLSLSEILEVMGSFYQDWDMDIAMRLFSYFGFDPDAHHSSMSKGMKSTFNMIVGLAARCPLTILDEPTTGMDAAVRKDFYRALLKDYIAYPRTIILSSHLLTEIEDLLEDVLLIKEGEKCLHLPLDELRHYAVGLTGNTERMNHAIPEEAILFRKNVGMDSTYAVVKNEGEKWMEGFHPTPVSTEDVCMYLTSQSKGGIDDVFS